MDGRGCQGAARNPQENVGLPWRLAGRARGTERIRGMEANPSGKARGAAEGMERSWDFMEFRGFSSEDVDPVLPTLPDSREIPFLWSEIVPVSAGRGGKRELIHGPGGAGGWNGPGAGRKSFGGSRLLIPLIPMEKPPRFPGIWQEETGNPGKCSRKS